MEKELPIYSRPERLLFKEARLVYWELEGRFLRGKSHKYELNRLEEFFGGMYLDQITPHDVRMYREHRKQESQDIRESSLNREHGRLTRIINAYKEWKRLGRQGPYDFSILLLPAENPGELVKKPSEMYYRRKLVVSPEMFLKFMDYAHPRVRRICTVAILTLLRKKDIRLLEDENLNRALDTVSGVQSKTGLPYNLPATLAVKIIFNEAKTEQREYVCDFTNFDNFFRRARRESGIYFQFRDLRRSGATQLLLEKIDIRTIQKLLGHADISTTEIYLNPPPAVSREAGRKLETAYFDTHPVLAGFCEN